MFIIAIDLASLRFFRSSTQVSDDKTLIEVRQEGGSAQDLFGKIMAPSGPAREHLTLVYGEVSGFSAISSTIGSACIGLDPYVGLHIHTDQMIGQRELEVKQHHQQVETAI
jgi:hypothetical protein